MGVLFVCTVVPCSGRLAVAGRPDGTFVTLFAGTAASFGSTGLALSGTPQQRNEKSPFFFGCRETAGFEAVLFGVPVGPDDVPCCVIDILLLVALPFRLLPKMLPFDSFDLPPILSAGSLTVAPLSPVVVGDGCILCEEDLDGTGRRPRFFFGTSGASSATLKESLSCCDPDKAVLSESSVVAVFCVEVAWVEELGGCGVLVTVVDTWLACLSLIHFPGQKTAGAFALNHSETNLTGDGTHTA